MVQLMQNTFLGNSLNVRLRACIVSLAKLGIIEQHTECIHKMIRFKFSLCNNLNSSYRTYKIFKCEMFEFVSDPG